MSDDLEQMKMNARAVPRHNSLQEHAKRLQDENCEARNARYEEKKTLTEAIAEARQKYNDNYAVTNVVNVVNTMNPVEAELDATERLIKAHQEYIKAKVLYILSKYCGPKHTSTVAIELFFQTIR